MQPVKKKWNRDNHRVRLVEHDRDANFSNPRFAEDILSITSSLKHTTTMLDDLITATTPHVQLHFTNQTPPLKHGNNTWDGHRDLATRSESQICRNNAVQVKFDHRIKCAWAIYKPPREVERCPLKDKRKLFTMTPSSSLPFRNLDDDRGNEGMSTTSPTTNSTTQTANQRTQLRPTFKITTWGQTQLDDRYRDQTMDLPGQ